MKQFLIYLAILTLLLCGPILALDYFGNGCMVKEHNAKLTETDYGYRFDDAVECRQVFIHTEEGRQAALNDDY